jgi:hypothetical protein
MCGSGHFVVGRLFVTISVSLPVIGLFHCVFFLKFCVLNFSFL